MSRRFLRRIGDGGGPAAINPNSSSGLQLWLDSLTGLTATSWQDRGPHSWNIAKDPIGANILVRAAITPNGSQAAQIATSPYSSFLARAGTLSGAPDTSAGCTLLTYVKPLGASAPTSQCNSPFSALGAVSNGVQLAISQKTAGGCILSAGIATETDFGGGNGRGVNSGQALSIGATPQLAWSWLGIVIDPVSNTNRVYRNNALVLESGPAVAAASAPFMTGYQIGGNSQLNDFEFCVASVLLYNRALRAAELAALQNYIKRTYG